MLTEQLQRMIDTIAQLPPEDQDRIARAIEEAIMKGGMVRPEVIAAAREMMEKHRATLEYLADK